MSNGKLSRGKRPRGRPRGSGIDDSTELARVADLLVRNPSLKPSSAMKRVMQDHQGRETPQTLLRRWQVKWKAKGASFLAAARDRASTPSYAPSPVPSDLNWMRLISDAQNSPWVQLVQEAQNSPLAKAMREMQNSPLAKAMREMQNSPLAEVMREMQNSPLAKAMREMQNSPLARAVREAQNLPWMRFAQEAKQMRQLHLTGRLEPSK
jgi:hypothetical protein